MSRVLFSIFIDIPPPITLSFVFLTQVRQSRRIFRFFKFLAILFEIVRFSEHDAAELAQLPQIFGRNALSVKKISSFAKGGKIIGQTGGGRGMISHVPSLIKPDNAAHIQSDADFKHCVEASNGRADQAGLDEFLDHLLPLF